MLSGKGVGAKLSKDERNIQLFCRPLVHFGTELDLRFLHLGTAADVPAVIPVQTDEITQLITAALVGRTVLLERTGQRTVLRVQCTGGLKDFREVILCILAGGFRLIEQAPRKNAGMVFVARHHLLDLLNMIFQQLRNCRCLEKVGVLACAGCGKVMGRTHHADSGDFINNKEALFICHLIPLFCIRVVAGAEAVGIRPFHALKIPLCDGPVEAAPQNIKILVLAKAFQVDRLSVDEDLCAANLHRADTDAFPVLIHRPAVLFQCDDDGVKIGVPHLPEMRVLHAERAFRTVCFCHQLVFRIQQLYRNLSCTFTENLVIHLCIRTVQRIAHLIVLNAFCREHDQIHTALDAGVVKEIEIRLNDLSAAGKDIVCSARQSALVQVVVHPDTDPVHRTTADNVRDIGDNGEKAAFMPGDLNTVAEHNCTVGNASKTKLHLALCSFGHKKILLIPEIAAVVPVRAAGEEIREAGRYRHGNGRRQTVFPVLSETAGLRVKLELPHPVQRQSHAVTVCNGVKD